MKIFFIPFALLTIVSCQTPKPIFTKIPQPFLSCNAGKNKVQILYTGCGGLAISSENDVILTDPYYTGHSIGLQGPDTNNTLKVLEKIPDPKKIKNVFISHSHYDHFEDLPYLLQRTKLADDVNVFSCPTASCVFAPFLHAAKPMNMDQYTYFQNQSASAAINWYSISSTMRILPIESRHAPHFLFFHFMRGNIKCGKFSTKRTSYAKQKAMTWKEGSVYSYLLDITSPDAVDTLRVFIQTSSCRPKFGLPPEKELAKKRVDLAIICAASYQWAPGYPKVLLKKLKPKKTLLIHWENFFKDMYADKLEVVPLTNMKKLLRKLKRYTNSNSDTELAEKLSIPKPLQQIEIEY